MSNTAKARYRGTRLTLALSAGAAVVAGGLFLAGNGPNGALPGSAATVSGNAASLAQAATQPTVVTQTARVSRGS